jgi:hypothetical protein
MLARAVGWLALTAAAIMAALAGLAWTAHGLILLVQAIP